MKSIAEIRRESTRLKNMLADANVPGHVRANVLDAYHDLLWVIEESDERPSTRLAQAAGESPDSEDVKTSLPKSRRRGHGLILGVMDQIDEWEHDLDIP